MANPKRATQLKLNKLRAEQELVVEVRREAYDGHVFSQVRNRARDLYDYEPEFPPVTIVIDRQKGRGLDQDTVTHRAEALAFLLGIPFEVDLSWPCAAEKGLPCRCPKCVDTTLRRHS